MTPAETPRAGKPEKVAPKGKPAWTLEEAIDQLRRNPRDPFLQYVAWQLARREKDSKAAVAEVEAVLADLTPRDPDHPDRRGQVDLFSLFTGASAVQESLQLDTLRGTEQRPREEATETRTRKVLQTVYTEVEETRTDTSGKEHTVRRLVPSTVATEVPYAGPGREARRKEIVDIATLKGPEVKSHPWKRMAAGKKPEISPLARFVPVDCYFVEFRSLARLLEAMELADQWGTHLVNQAMREARSRRVGERLQQQLALEVHPELRPFYDLAVAEVAVAGHDLFLREGSDVTLLFRLSRPEVFQDRVDRFLADAEKAHPDARKTTGTFQGVDYVCLATPDRSVSVYSAYPRPDLHVRSNSPVAFKRILEAIQGKRADGSPVARLGDSDEFAFIRSIMPRGAAEEDGFVYLSDPFIRRQVSARVKLTERRRLMCYNHLRMIGHAALLYRAENGKAPQSLADLIKAGCAPGLFGEGDLACPDGGKYSLSPDGTQGCCSIHGTADFLTPCCEHDLSRVRGDEADDYAAFVSEYDQYWRTFFDPIAVRIQITPQRYRLETLVLPLSDNSIYGAMAAALGGKPEPLEALPVPPKNILTLGFRLDKEKLLKQLEDAVKENEDSISPKDLAKFVQVSEKDLARLDYKRFREFLDRGLGNQVGIHLYDSVPIVDFNVSSLFAAGLASRGSSQADLAALGVAILAASLNSPLYLSIPVQDAAIVDRFLESLDPLFTNRIRVGDGLSGFEQDFYFLRKDRDAVVRGNVLRFGPVKVRFFSGRIGNAFYIAITNKPFILDDLVALEAARKRGELKSADAGPVAHAMFRIRAENWNQVLPDFRLGWAENNRVACLDNLAPLSSVACAVSAARGRPTDTAEALRTAERLHGVRFICPEGGSYCITPDGKKCTCTVHGWDREPRQQSAPLDAGPSAKLMREFAGMTGTLTFREDGLQAVLVIERKQPK
jgi:hypothetical protein